MDCKPVENVLKSVFHGTNVLKDKGTEEIIHGQSEFEKCETKQSLAELLSLAELRSL